MASLAKELAARGKILKDPYQEHIEKAHAAGIPFEDLEAAEDHKYNSDDESEGTAYSEEKQVSFETMSGKKASITSPSSAMKKKAPQRKLSAISGGVGAPIANGIAAPIVKGCFLVRDPKTRKRFNHYHIRMLWHNFVTTGDIFYEWIDDRTLKVVVYDPNWWSDPEYQAAFDSAHGKDSNLIDSMIDFQEDRKEQVPGQDKKRTGNTGYFVFGEAMSIKEEDDTVVIPQAILHNTINGVYIVIKVRVAHDDLAAEESTPRKAKAGGAAVTVGIGKNFVNVRPRDDDDMEEEEEEEEMETQNRPAKRTFTPRLKQKPHTPYPPMHLVTLPQANLQVTASAAATAGALTKIDSSDDESTIVVDDMGIDLPDDEED
jgi:hypothetical protein